MISLIYNINNKGPNTDTCGTPPLTFPTSGCDVWGFGKHEVLGRVHLKFCKILLKLKFSTPNLMVYGELGRYPIDIDIKVRTISYWARLLSGKQVKFSNVFYRLSRNLIGNGDTNLNWVYFIRTILNECGFTYIWETENVNNKEWLKCVVKQRLLDQFVQNWQTSLSDSSKALNYRFLKPNSNSRNISIF